MIPNFLKGAKDGGAGPDGDAHLSPQDPSPLVIPFPLSEPAVEQGEILSESILEAGEKLRGQRYLRDENDRLFPQGQHLLNGPEVDFRLSASGDPMDQKRRKSIRLNLLRDLLRIWPSDQGWVRFWIRF